MIACENIRFSSLFAADVFAGYTIATERIHLISDYTHSKQERLFRQQGVVSDLEEKF